MFALNSCSNDAKYSGAYKILSSKHNEEIQNNDTSSYLILEKKHTFKIKFNEQSYEGEWKFYDTGDNSIINFYLKEENKK